jgi:hypothetical protein
MKGYMGLAPHSARQGDLVCILLGGQTPFILREMEDMTSLERLQEIFGRVAGTSVALLVNAIFMGLWTARFLPRLRLTVIPY